jgi:mannose-6-phosphate isomerase-like protein (cupin superfamily)
MDPQGKPRISKVDIEAKCEEIEEPWSPVDIATVNDQVVRMALFHGEYHWHRHEREDELFYVHRGEVTIRIRGHNDVVLGSGEMVVVPRDVEHRPESVGPSYVLMFEPLQLKSKGD